MNLMVHHLPCWALVLLILSACATSPEDEARTERKRAEKENSRSLVFGASGAAFSPTGSQVAVANRKQIWIADTTSGRVTARLKSTNAAPFGNSKGLEFLDEKRLVIGAQGAILIWDLQEGLVTHKLPLPNHLYMPRAMAWSKATQTLAFSVGISRASVKVVPIMTNGFGQLQDVPGFEGVPGDLAFSRDGRYIAATGDGSGVYVREIATGDFAGELPTEGVVNSLEQFDNNKLLVSGASIAVWAFFSDEEALQFGTPDLQGQIDGQVAARVAGGVALGAMAYALWPLLILGAGGNCGLGCGGADSLYLAVTEGYALATKPLKTSAQPWCGRSNSISPDGKLLADVYPGITKEIIAIYDMESGEKHRELNPKGEYSCVVKFSPNGRQLLLTTSKTARLYDTENWRYFDLALGKP